MKRIFTLALVFSSITLGMQAQGEMSAFGLSYNDLKGTARSVGMGGAFGALGGDISGISINPAGIGVYTSSEVVTTLNFTNTESKTSLLGKDIKEKKFKFAFDNIAFVGNVPLNSDVVPLLNFGFSYNRLKSFDRKVNMNGNFAQKSLTDYMANEANDRDFGKGTPVGDITWNADNLRYTDYWLSTLGYTGGLMKPAGNGQYKSFAADLTNPNFDNSLYFREKGSIDTYDFNVGTTFADILSAGVTISVTDINYHLSSTYSEDFYEGDKGIGNYFLDNYLKTEGTGWQVKAGVIVKPVQELRIGVAYHSPTWYEMTDYTFAVMDAFGKAYDTSDLIGAASTDYRLRTPDKWVFSLAGIIGQRAIISADYELTNYRNMQLKEDTDRYGNAYDTDNGLIKQDFKNASTLRVGAEIRITPQFSGRVGYSWQESPVKKILKSGDAVPGTYTSVTHYSLVGDTNSFTWGLGYKFTPSFYTDFAFVVKNRKDDLYSFGGSDKAELKTNQVTGLVTFGVRF